MSLEREFDRRIAAIHGIDNPVRHGSNIEESTMDVRHAEFQAMASVFLGVGFDPTKLGQVEDLQVALHKQQAELYHRYEAGELGPEEYVESFNTSLDDTFAKCEAILGPEVFLKLFGAPRSALAGFIDRETFLQANQRDEINSQTDEEDEDIDTSDSPPLDDSFFARARLRMPRTRTTVPAHIQKIRQARRQKEIYRMITRAEVELTKALRRNPTIEEVAEKIKLTIQQIQHCVDAMAVGFAAALSDPEGAPASRMAETTDPERTILLSEMLSRLSAREREIIHLYYWEDKSHEEIAQSLGLTVSNATKIRRRAIDKLRKRLEVKQKGGH